VGPRGKALGSATEAEAGQLRPAAI
jgi:hypothetical protein